MYGASNATGLVTTQTQIRGYSLPVGSKRTTLHTVHHPTCCHHAHRLYPSLLCSSTIVEKLNVLAHSLTWNNDLIHNEIMCYVTPLALLNPCRQVLFPSLQTLFPHADIDLVPDPTNPSVDRFQYWGFQVACPRTIQKIGARAELQPMEWTL